MAWHRAVERVRPNALHYTYLDDRLVVETSWEGLQAVLVATAALDKALGPMLNMSKCCKGVVRPPGKLVPVLSRNLVGSTLAAIQIKRTFRYLGVDMVMDGNAPRPVAKRRLVRFVARCRIAQALPRQQRPAALSDAVASLWVPGLCIYNQRQITTAVSAGFVTLAGCRNLGRRSRAMTHLLGPAPHVTHLALAMAYGCLRQWLRMRLSGRLTLPVLETQWMARDVLFTGPIVQLRAALHWLGILWESPTRFGFPPKGLLL